MGQIVKTFLGIALGMILMVSGMSVLQMQADSTAARNFKNDVLSEMESSDYNPDVINACFQTAASLGYSMVVSIYTGSGSPQTYRSGAVSQTSGATMAYVTIKYPVSLLGRDMDRTIEGCTA